MKSILVIAAAGLGRRMNTSTPKCLAELEGMPNLVRWLTAIPHSKFRTVLVVGYESHKVVERISAYRQGVLIVENKQFAQSSALDSYKLGIASFLDNCDPAEHAAFLDKPAMIICGDLVMKEIDMQKLFEAKDEEFCGISPVATSGATSVQLCEDGSHIIEISENREERATWFWGNYGNIKAKTILGTKGSFLRDVARANLPIKAVKTQSTDYDTIQDLVIAQKLLKS